MVYATCVCARLPRTLRGMAVQMQKQMENNEAAQKKTRAKQIMPDSIRCDLAQIVRRTFAKTLPIQIDRTKVEKVVCLRYHWRVGYEPANIPPNRRANVWICRA